ncbi:aldose epimerase family protein [Metabacillus sp. RGM 3146]|uniref:aldose epimerase family protein n=1 Tax=Metabacillus sp. RGM 3146 TaxID=3401092 RepID=UPI003B9A1D3A
MEIEKRLFGMLNDRNISAYTLKNDHGIEMTCIEYGCVITKLLVPNQNGKAENIVLGFEHLDGYLNHSPYFGAAVGRVAGRIKRGEFTLDGKEYQLDKNDGNNHLHGGDEGFSLKIWSAETNKGEDEASIRFTYSSRAGEEGYPGQADVSVTYTLTNQNELIIRYRGETDEPTLMNMTNHTYFNLSGSLDRTILDHKLFMNSSTFLELDEESIPTGKLVEVDETPFDFRKEQKLKTGKESNHPQTILAGNGYDHPFVLDKNLDGPEIILTDEESGRVLKVNTDQPCVILYTSNKLTDSVTLQDGVQVQKYLGVCLETQKHPDAIHHEHFPSIIVDENERYEAMTKWSFDTIRLN